jgi:hypothetical protein
MRRAKHPKTCAKLQQGIHADGNGSRRRRGNYSRFRGRSPGKADTLVAGRFRVTDDEERFVIAGSPQA